MYAWYNMIDVDALFSLPIFYLMYPEDSSRHPSHLHYMPQSTVNTADKKWATGTTR